VGWIAVAVFVAFLSFILGKQGVGVFEGRFTLADAFVLGRCIRYLDG